MICIYLLTNKQLSNVCHSFLKDELIGVQSFSSTPTSSSSSLLVILQKECDILNPIYSFNTTGNIKNENLSLTEAVIGSFVEEASTRLNAIRFLFLYSVIVLFLNDVCKLF
jgi:hypothetical protein